MKTRVNDYYWPQMSVEMVFLEAFHTLLVSVLDSKKVITWSCCQRNLMELHQGTLVSANSLWGRCLAVVCKLINFFSQVCLSYNNSGCFSAQEFEGLQKMQNCHHMMTFFESATKTNNVCRNGLKQKKPFQQRSGINRIKTICLQF